jgi:hypothetical protein
MIKYSRLVNKKTEMKNRTRKRRKPKRSNIHLIGDPKGKKQRNRIRTK